VLRGDAEDFITDCVEITGRTASDEKLLVFDVGCVCTHNGVEVLCLRLTHEGHVAEEIQSGADLEGVHDPTADDIRYPCICILHMQFEVISGRRCQFLPELRCNNEVDDLFLRGHEVGSVKDTPSMGVYVDLVRIVLVDGVSGVIPAHAAAVRRVDGSEAVGYAVG
jgi:hypothetical protein